MGYLAILIQQSDDEATFNSLFCPHGTNFCKQFELILLVATLTKPLMGGNFSVLLA